MFGVPYHFLAVHFPLVLVVLALLYDARGLHDIGHRLTMGAAGGALVASATGLMLAGGQLSQITVHAGAGLLGSFAVVALAMLRYSRKAREEEPTAGVPATWLVLEALAAVCFVIGAFTGHRAVLGY